MAGPDTHNRDRVAGQAAHGAWTTGCSTAMPMHGDDDDDDQDARRPCEKERVCLCPFFPSSLPHRVAAALAITTNIIIIGSSSSSSSGSYR